METPRVLIVDEEPVSRMQMEARLRQAGYSASAVAGADQALAPIERKACAILITDLLLQCSDGGSLISAARARDPDLELIVLAGATSIDAMIAAANFGVQAYLRRPVRAGELEERVAAALERWQARSERRRALWQLGAQLMRIAERPGPAYGCGGADGGCLCVGSLELDPQQRRAAIDRRALPLSSGEFELLLYLARRERQVISAEQIAREVLHWGCCSPAEARELVKVRIHRLRQKIERDPHAPALLVSVRGAGYMLTAGG